jgi:hypothetical protein
MVPVTALSGTAAAPNVSGGCVGGGEVRGGRAGSRRRRRTRTPPGQQAEAKHAAWCDSGVWYRKHLQAASGSSSNHQQESRSSGFHCVRRLGPPDGSPPCEGRRSMRQREATLRRRATGILVPSMTRRPGGMSPLSPVDSPPNQAFMRAWGAPRGVPQGAAGPAVSAPPRARRPQAVAAHGCRVRRARSAQRDSPRRAGSGSPRPNPPPLRAVQWSAWTTRPPSWIARAAR